MRILAHIVAWACMVAMPFSPLLCGLNPAFADEMRVYLEPATLEWHWRWDPASGPVVGYEVCVSYVCGEQTWQSCHRAADNTTVITMLEWVPQHVRVQAFDELDKMGPWSEASLTYVINPLRGDADLNCAVGVTDFSILSQEWGRVSLGELGVCDGVEEVREVPILQAGWEGMLGYEFPRKLWWWFLDAFEDDQAQRTRNHAAADEIRAVFLDLNRLHFRETGEPSLIPEKLIRCLERRVVAKLAPSAYEIATGSLVQPVARVSLALKTRTPEVSWRTKS